MFCNQCGSKLAEEAAFCNKCGTKMVVGDAVPPVQPRQPQPKARSKMTYIIAGLAVALVAIVIVAAALSGGNGEPSGDAQIAYDATEADTTPPQATPDTPPTPPPTQAPTDTVTVVGQGNHPEELLGLWKAQDSVWAMTHEFLPGGVGVTHTRDTWGERSSDFSWEVQDSVLYWTAVGIIWDHDFHIVGDELHLMQRGERRRHSADSVLIRVDSTLQAPTDTPPTPSPTFIYDPHDEMMWGMSGWWVGTYNSGAGIREIYMWVFNVGNQAFVRSFLVDGSELTGLYASELRFNTTLGRFETVNSQWLDERTGPLAEKYLWLDGDFLTGHMNPRADGSSREDFWYSFERYWGGWLAFPREYLWNPYYDAG